MVPYPTMWEINDSPQKSAHLVTESFELFKSCKYVEKHGNAKPKFVCVYVFLHGNSHWSEYTLDCNLVNTYLLNGYWR